MTADVVGGRLAGEFDRLREGSWSLIEGTADGNMARKSAFG